MIKQVLLNDWFQVVLLEFINYIHAAGDCIPVIEFVLADDTSLVPTSCQLFYLLFIMAGPILKNLAIKSVLNFIELVFILLRLIIVYVMLILHNHR